MVDLEQFQPLAALAPQSDLPEVAMMIDSLDLEERSQPFDLVDVEFDVVGPPDVALLLDHDQDAQCSAEGGVQPVRIGRLIERDLTRLGAGLVSPGVGDERVLDRAAAQLEPAVLAS